MLYGTFVQKIFAYNAIFEKFRLQASAYTSCCRASAIVGASYVFNDSGSVLPTDTTSKSQQTQMSTTRVFALRNLRNWNVRWRNYSKDGSHTEPHCCK